ncbi:MAG TPA: AI-2E family transporter [Candidatus Acidoferrum sp.]|nr:AI-2E family transporter [Candidatus Acidoferrum sp.]
MMHSSADLLQQRLLSRIAWLLWVIVLVLLMAFCFFASSFCITLLLAAFLAILVDPLVTYLESWQVPRSASAGIIVVAGMLFICFLTYASYNRISDIVETMPQYAERIRDVVKPLNQKIAKVQETAGSLNPEVPTKKIAEVKIKEPSSWPSYMIRGVGPVWSAIIIIGVVPFLMFFNLIRKEQIKQRLALSFGSVIDVPQFVGRLTQMVRGFAAGNLVIGSAMATVTILVLFALKIQGAMILGIVSGFLNLIPFLGVILAALVPVAAALLQFSTAASFAIILLTVVCLHIISANFLIPKVVGSRVNIGPVAATAGILFWGWLWGLMGVLLSVPLTALVKLIADSHPSFIHISNLLAESPPSVSSWIQSGRETICRTVPYIRKRSPAKIKL